MSRREAMILIGAIVLLSVGLEVASRWNQRARAAVEIVNDGGAPLKDLVVDFGDLRVTLGDVDPGGSARVWLDAGRAGTVTLSFSQLGNPLTGFSLDDVDPDQLNVAQLKLVARVRPGEVAREVDDDPSDPAPLSGLSRRILDRVRYELSFR